MDNDNNKNGHDNGSFFTINFSDSELSYDSGMGNQQASFAKIDKRKKHKRKRKDKEREGNCRRDKDDDDDYSSNRIFLDIEVETLNEKFERFFDSYLAAHDAMDNDHYPDVIQSVPNVDKEKEDEDFTDTTTTTPSNSFQLYECQKFKLEQESGENSKGTEDLDNNNN